MDYASMNGPELVVEYNRLAASLGKKSIKKFSSVDAGRKRVKALAKEIEGPAATSGRGRKKKEVTYPSDTLAEAFHPGGKKMPRLVDAFVAQLNNFIEVKHLLSAVYGNQNSENTGALVIIIRRVEQHIK